MDNTMSRNKPEVILDYTDPVTYKSVQVLKAEFTYAVYYQGNPINLRNLHSLISYPGPKYRKIAFASEGFAFNLAAKLNILFKTDQFEVYRLDKPVLISR